MSASTDKTFNQLLADQVGHEFAAHHQYIAIAVYYDSQTLPRLAAFFYRQALEERTHAMIILQYLMDAEMEIRMDAVEAAQTGFADIVEPAQLALDQERRVTDQIVALAAKARDEGDYQSEQFMQWFIKEQLEEVTTASDLLHVVERSKANPLQAEEYLARENFGEEDADPTAPPAAGE